MAKAPTHIKGYLLFASLCVEVDALNKTNLSGPIAIMAQRYRNGYQGFGVLQMKSIAEAVNTSLGGTTPMLVVEGRDLSVWFSLGGLSVRSVYRADGTADIIVALPRCLEGYVQCVA
jgi:hypothetical protein